MFNVKRLRVSIAVLFSLLLAACGGGGGGGGGGGAPPPADTPPPAPAPAVVTPMVVGGNGFSFALKRDGTVFGWGDQQNGTLGDGEAGATGTRVPHPVLNVSGITQIEAGSNHGIARRNDGVVFVWGANNAGQLGVGGGGPIARPVQLGLSNIIAVAAGGDFSLALRGDGMVFAWGENTDGQLGLGDNVDRSSPVQIPNLSGVNAIAAGGSHALAIRDNGTVFAWGNNLNGQLGLGNMQLRNVPTQITALNGLNVKRVAAGEFHSLALAANGSVRGWGSSCLGEVGVRAPTAIGCEPNANGFGSFLLPVQVTSLPRVAVAIAAGSRHSLALLDNETIRTWGHNGSGRLGNGTAGVTSSTFVPQTPQISTVMAIAAGDTHSLIILSDGRVGCFGDNFFSQCGQPQGFSELTTPNEVGSPVLNVNQ